MKRVHLQTLGCRLNEAELEHWARGFRALGLQLAEQPEQADMVVINTCAVTSASVRKSRNLVRRAQRANPKAKLVMTGCYAALSAEQAATELGVDLVVSNTEKDRLVELAQSAFGLMLGTDTAPDPDTHSLLAQNRQRAFIKVQDGCRYRCTYCVVTLARGEERSRPVDDIIRQIQQLQEEHIHEVVLAGVHLGGYGSDIGSSLSELVNAVLTQTKMPRVRLGSVEPWDLPDDFWPLFDNPRLMPHLHLPMQSGADSVLRRMSRRCKSKEFIQLIEQARARVPDFNVTTDIIVGFPGETEAEWQQTLDFVDQIGFGHIHIFAFSPREGTKAATLACPISREVKRQRSEQLHAISARDKAANLSQYLDREFEILIEGSPQIGLDGSIQWHGYTPNYLRVEMCSPEKLENQLITIKTTSIDANGEQLLGEIVAH